MKREPWMGQRKRGIREATKKHDALIGSLASQKAIPMLRLKHRLGYAVVLEGSQWDIVVGAMPRKPYKFLAMVAEMERKREIAEQVQKKRAAAKVRYQKRIARRKP